MRASLVVLFGIAAGTAAVVIPPRLVTHEPLVRGEDAPARGSERTVTFVVWGMPFEDRLFLDLYARGFEKSSAGQNTRVDYQRHSDPNLKYNAWHARGFGAECMRIMVTDYHQMVARGMLEPLDAYIDDPREGLTTQQLADFPPQLLDSLRVNGHLYALPQDTAVFGMYYNKSIFDDYNRAHPQAPLAYPNADWTWEDLRDAAANLTQRDARGNPTVYGLDMSIWQWPFMNFFAQAGGKQWSDDGLTTLINSDAGVRALEFFRTLAYEDRSWSPFFGKDQGTGPDSRFAAGQVAIYFDGSWMLPNFEKRNPNLNFAVSPVPRGPRERGTHAVVCGSCLWGIGIHAKNKPEGWRMIRWLVSPEQAIRYWDTLRVAPPASLSVINSDGFRSTAGISDPATPGAFLVPPLPRDRYEDRAAWLLKAFEPDPQTGRAPGFVPTSLYQRALEDEVARMLQDYLRSPTGPSAQDLLDRTARAVHATIDRDRAAQGLPAVAR